MFPGLERIIYSWSPATGQYYADFFISTPNTDSGVSVKTMRIPSTHYVGMATA